LAARRRCNPNDQRETWASRRTTRFPTAMHVAAVQAVHEKLLAQRPGAAGGRSRPRHTSGRDVVKIGRTHLEDARAADRGAGVVPAYAHQLAQAAETGHRVQRGPVTSSRAGRHRGRHRGLNAPPGFSGEGIARRDRQADWPSVRHRGEQVRRPGRPGRHGWARSAGLRALAVPLMKIAQRHPLARLRAPLRAWAS